MLPLIPSGSGMDPLIGAWQRRCHRDSTIHEYGQGEPECSVHQKDLFLRQIKDTLGQLIFCCFFCFSTSHALNKPQALHLSKGAQELWLFGSIHAGTERMYPLDQIQSAWQQSQALVVETQIQGPLNLNHLIFNSSNSETLQLKPSQQQIWLALTHKYGMSPEKLQPFRLWYLGMILSQWQASEMHLDPSLGVDLQLMDRARKEGKSIRSLESPESQLQILASLPVDLAQIWIGDLLEQWGENEKMGLKLLEAWQNQDCQALLDLDNPPGESAQTQRLHAWYTLNLLDNRNRAMTDSLKKWTEEGLKPLVVVGAAHLCGNNGIVSLLQKQGWNVQP